MKINIIGAGIIGGNLAKTLSDEDHDVYLIEENEETARKINEKLDVKVFTGNGADPDALEKANTAEADLVIAVTTSDETNLVVCSLAKYLGAQRCIARVRNTSLNRILKGIGGQYFNINEIINPEEVAAEAIVKTVLTPGTREVADFANGKILLRAFDVLEKSSLCNLKIGEFREEDFPWPFLIVSILRNKEVLFPKGDTVVKASDRIYVLLPSPSLGAFLSFIHPNVKMPKKIIIYGATEIGKRVAMSLTEKVRDLVLLEESAEKAESVAGRLGATCIINGSACEKDILIESGIEATDAFIATSDNDHTNLVSAVLAKKMGAKSTTIITQQPDYLSIVEPLGIDAAINPRLLAMQQILRLVRGKGLESMAKFMDGGAEALEFIPEEGAPITKKAIKNIPFPKNSIIGAILRGDEVILAKGDTQIHAGERVIVFCQDKAVKKLHTLFTHKKFI